MNLKGCVTHSVVLSGVALGAAVVVCRIAGRQTLGDCGTAFVCVLVVCAVSTLANLAGGWRTLRRLDEEAVRTLDRIE